MFKKIVIAVAVVVVIGGAVVGGVKYKQLRDKYNKVKNPQQTAQQEAQDLVSKVGKLTILPSDETPTIATVADVSKLANQAFFKDAKNGDKVLIYTKSKKAILYRPSTNQIIQIAPVNIGASQTPAKK